jgi:tRNA(Ile)-lysidine synthase TilS/MesJ
MKRCTRCILPETFPGISFNREGVCNFCERSRPLELSRKLMEKYEAKFHSLIEKRAGSGAYDVIMAYSGGKDSTYTLYLFVKRYGLRVLALTFDNTFISPMAFENIKKVCSVLGVDSYVVRPNPQMLRKIFSTAAKRELYSPKTLERASTICTSCIGMVKAIVLRTAIEKAIPFVGFGWSPGQAPINASVMQTNASFMKKAQEAIHAPLREIAGPAIDPYFLSDEQFEDPGRFPWNIHPLAFTEYNEEKIVEKNRQLGWRRPQDTDPNSSNCLLNAYANHIHRQRYRFHPYVWEIANMVRQGVMSRQEGLDKIEPPENQTMVEYCKKILEPVQQGA